MSYYLELNPIVSFGKRLSEVNSLEPSVFTSIWAIIELLAELRPETFRSIQSRLKVVMDSGILVDWEDPTTILYSAFRMRYKNIDVPAANRRIVENVIVSRDLLDLETRFPASFYRVSLFVSLRQESRTLVSRINRLMAGASQVSVEERARNYDFEGIYIRKLADFIAKQTGIGVVIVEAGYTGRLDAFIKGLKAATFNMTQLGKNDEEDLYHLYYANESATDIVSNDAIFSRLGFTNVLSVSEFKNRIGWKERIGWRKS